MGDEQRVLGVERDVMERNIWEWFNKCHKVYESADQ